MNSWKFGKRRWTARAVAAAAIAMVPLAFPGVASAAPLVGCTTTNLVCLYDGGRTFIGAYADTTYHWQELRTGRVAYVKNRFNVRNAPRVVYFRHGRGPRAVTSCAEPGREASTRIAGYGAVTAIQIRPGTKCYYGDVPSV